MSLTCSHSSSPMATVLTQQHWHLINDKKNQILLCKLNEDLFLFAIKTAGA